MPHLLTPTATALPLGVGLGLVLLLPPAHSQGCVAARGAGVTCGALAAQPGATIPPGAGIQASINYRWFRSDRHYVGDVEQTERQAEGSEVINRSNFIDLGLVNAPVALYRNRERSVPDMQLAQASGISRHGDAAFADFALLFSVAHRF
jgi:hypothetical protein